MSDNVQHWVSQMQHRGWFVDPEPVRLDRPLADGQWRLEPGARVRARVRRRRIVRVSTLKYRSMLSGGPRRYIDVSVRKYRARKRRR